MIEIFVSDSNDQMFEHVSSYVHIRQEFWNWAEKMLGEDDERRWSITPDSRYINNKIHHGRNLMFRDSKDAMLFKLTWM